MQANLIAWYLYHTQPHPRVFVKYELLAYLKASIRRGVVVYNKGTYNEY